MSDYLIVVANRAGARFFTLEPVEFPELESGPRMTLRAELENSEIKDVREKYMDAKAGRGAAPRGAGVHGYEDKRDQHLDQLRRQFAARLVKHIKKLVKIERVGTVILASSVKMRQFLYPQLDTLARQGCLIHKLSKNMINFSPQKIHECLADDGLVPRQEKT